MALELRRQRDGKYRDCWYGAYVDSHGKRKAINLGIKWSGIPPASGRLTDTGDAAFERSREKAEAALAHFVDEIKHKGRAEYLTERLIESKTGRAVEYTKIAELPARWRSLGRDATVSEGYLKACDAQFNRFIQFMRQRNPSAVFLYEITSADAAAFMTACRAALAPGTAKDCAQLVSKALTRFLPVGAANPFSSFVGRRSNGESGIIHRKPFTPEELRSLLDAARGETFMYPLVVCAAMTGMRRGDVCNLKWSNVDLPGGMLAVKTSKTEATVEIPIFPMLRSVLEERQKTGNGYVFPEAAEMLKINPDGLTWRFKKIVARAFAGEDESPTLNLVPASKVVGVALSAIRNNTADGARRDRMIDIMTRYADGQSVREIEKATGTARATISTDLHTIQTWTGKRFVRGGITTTSVKSEVARLTRVTRSSGQRAASVRDWHALRVTWITFALAAGVPMELVRRVTGHSTVDVVLKHYFRPDREQFRATLAGAMPDVISGGSAKHETPADKLAELVAKIQAGTATEADKKQIRLLAAKV